MSRKLIRLTIVEPAETPEDEGVAFRDFVKTAQQMLADTGTDLQVAYWGGAGYDRIMLRLRRICPEEVAQADLAFFLSLREDDSFLEAEFDIACDHAETAGKPFCAMGRLSGDDACRTLMSTLVELDPSLPITIDDRGRVLIGEKLILMTKRESIAWSLLFDDRNNLVCPECGGPLRRYDDWFICESCHSIG